jgi:hypothetical protein
MMRSIGKRDVDEDEAEEGMVKGLEKVRDEGAIEMRRGLRG